MRSSSKLEKTKLPVDTFEGWLKTQSRQPERGRRPEKHTADSYDLWIGKRVEKRAQEPTVKKKGVTS